MSGPSVWNGRNERILGQSNDSETSINTLATSNVDSSTAKPAENSSNCSATNTPMPAPVPTRSVWNGKHDNIKAMAVPSPPPTASTDVSDTKKKNFTKKKKGNSNNATSKVVLPTTIKDVSRVDESTNSTAGSSTTNTIEEEPSTDVTRTSGSNGSVESGVVVNVTSPSCLTNGDDKKEKSDATGLPVVVGEKKKKERSSSNGNAAKNQKNKGGGNSSRQNNHQRGGKNGNNKHHSGTNTRGNGQNGGGNRRKANNPAPINNIEKPVCAFFIRGTCNRGTACAFKHEPGFAPPPSSLGYQGNAHYQRHDSNGIPNQMPPSSIPPYNRLAAGGRVFDPFKARAIQLAKDAQDKEDRTTFASIHTHQELAKEPTEPASNDPPFFSIDVECIATGYGSCARGINDGVGNEGKNREGVPSNQYNELSHRYPGRVAMVDSEGNLLVDIIIRPPGDGAGVVSYLTALTGLTKEMCLGPESKSLEEAVSTIKSLLPKGGVLVGQAINHDVEWLGLTPGQDFDKMVDLSVIFRQRLPAMLGKASDVLRNAESGVAIIGNKNADPSSDEFVGFDTRYRSFSLRHVCLNLLGTDIQSGVHDPVVDARYSLTLFHKYRNSSVTQLRIVRDGLHRAPVTPGFAAEKTPVLDGVCVSAAGYPYKRAARKIWRWYLGKKGQQ